MKNQGLKPPIIWITTVKKFKEQWVPVVGISLTNYLELGWATTVVSRCTVPWLRERETKVCCGDILTNTFRIEKKRQLFFWLRGASTAWLMAMQEWEKWEWEVAEKKKWLEDGIPWKIHGSC